MMCADSSVPERSRFLDRIFDDFLGNAAGRGWHCFKDTLNLSLNDVGRNTEARTDFRETGLGKYSEQNVLRRNVLVPKSHRHLIGDCHRAAGIIAKGFVHSLLAIHSRTAVLALIPYHNFGGAGLIGA